MEMDRDKLKEWCIAGACSVAIHAFLIFLFAFFGKAPSDPAPQPDSVAATRETKPAPPPEPPPETDVPTSTTTAPSEPRTRNYTVQQGDYLLRLAKKNNTTTAELARLNGKDEEELAKLKPGQIIKLPAVD